MSTATAPISIVDAMRDPHLFAPYFGGVDALRTWKRWEVALRAVYGLPIKHPKAKQLVRRCTGRRTLLKDGFKTALFLTGRRSGKSRAIAAASAYEAVLAGHERKLAAGETGIVACLAPTLSQAKVVHSYLRGLFESSTMLSNEVESVTRDSFMLKSGVRLTTLASDWRTVRGFTLLAAVVDEAAFMGLDAESKVKSDTELIRAIQPGLASIGGRLIAISSPYARKGWCHTTWKQNHGNEDGDVLVWNCPSRTMNPTLSRKVVESALKADPAAARSEYLGEFRDDVATFLPRDVIEACVVHGRRELLPRLGRTGGETYFAFCDVSGGRADDATLAIAHLKGDTVVVDCLKRYRPPFSPQTVIEQMAEVVKKYGLRFVVGDNYAAEFVNRAFEKVGIRYRRCEKPKSALYLELLPRLCSREVELLDDPALIDQIAGLERRTRSGGADRIDHASGGRDDAANAVAGVCFEVAGRHRVRVGAIL